jgi:hypothetical protein
MEAALQQKILISSLHPLLIVVCLDLPVRERIFEQQVLELSISYDRATTCRIYLLTAGVSVDLKLVTHHRLIYDHYAKQ